MNFTKSLSWLLFTLSFLIASTHYVYAQESHIQDKSNALTPEMKSKLNKLLEELEVKKNLRIEEVILPSLEGKDPIAVVEEIEQKSSSHVSSAQNRALLIFILDNNYVQIVANKNLEPALNDQNKSNIIENATKKMKEKNYDEMARVGIAGVYHYYQKANRASTDHGTTTNKTLYNMLFMLLILGVVLAVIKFTSKKP